LQSSISAALLAPDSHIRRSGRDLAIPREQEQANNTQEVDYQLMRIQECDLTG